MILKLYIYNLCICKAVVFGLGVFPTSSPSSSLCRKSKLFFYIPICASRILYPLPGLCSTTTISLYCIETSLGFFFSPHLVMDDEGISHVCNLRFIPQGKRTWLMATIRSSKRLKGLTFLGIVPPGSSVTPCIISGMENGRMDGIGLHLLGLRNLQYCILPKQNGLKFITKDII